MEEEINSLSIEINALRVKRNALIKERARLGRLSPNGLKIINTRSVSDEEIIESKYEGLSDEQVRDKFQMFGLGKIKRVWAQERWRQSPAGKFYLEQESKQRKHR